MSRRVLISFAVLAVVGPLASAALAQTTGACCYNPDAGRASSGISSPDVCLYLTETACEDLLTAGYYGDGSDCTVCLGGGSGACCLESGCFVVADETACEDLKKVFFGGGPYRGDGTSCIPAQTFVNNCPPPPPPDMPAVTTWGVAVVMLLLLAAMTVVFRRRAAA